VKVVLGGRKSTTIIRVRVNSMVSMTLDVACVVRTRIGISCSGDRQIRPGSFNTDNHV
jgi:hypothetical protein